MALGDTIPFTRLALGRRPVPRPRRDDARWPALLVVIVRDIIRCGLAMMVCFAALAGIYVLLGAPLVAAAQVLVYIGAISVLILFAIMLTQSKVGPARLVFQPRPCRRRVAAVVLAVVVGPRDRRDRLGRAGASGSTSRPTSSPASCSTTTSCAFEIVSVLLLAAVIGGVFLAKRERGRGARDPGLRGRSCSSRSRSASA